MKLFPIDERAKTGEWVFLYGIYFDQPKGAVGFWAEDEGTTNGDWYGSGCASSCPLSFGWQPTHWAAWSTSDRGSVTPGRHARRRSRVEECRRRLLS